MSKKPVINVVGAAIESNGKFLCVRRGKSKNRETSFKFEFPGGKIEKEETPEIALQRELQEELNIDIPIKPENFLITSINEYEEVIVKLSIYLVPISKVEFYLKEHIQYVWMEAKDLLDLDWSPADIPAARLLTTKVFT